MINIDIQYHGITNLTFKADEQEIGYIQHLHRQATKYIPHWVDKKENKWLSGCITGYYLVDNYFCVVDISVIGYTSQTVNRISVTEYIKRLESFIENAGGYIEEYKPERTRDNPAYHELGDLEKVLVDAFLFPVELELSMAKVEIALLKKQLEDKGEIIAKD